MRIPTNVPASKRAIGIAAGLAVAGFAILAGSDLTAEAGPKASKVWRDVAKRLRTSAKAQAKADYFLELARINLEPIAAERKDDQADAKDEFKDAKGLAKDQYDARLQLAIDLGETELYSVDIDPTKFSATITNPLLPFTVGHTWTYRITTPEGVETIVVEVLDETKTIMGVECAVVRDTVTLDGVLIEDTLDWYSQDDEGNVWYFGELALNYEDGEVIDIDGSWVTGIDDAQPGIIMLAAPKLGDIYRQEFYLGEAEDWARVESLDESVTVAFGSYTNCLQTLDALTIEPEALEHKYFAPGVGLVLEVDVETGDRVELIDMTTGNN